VVTAATVAHGRLSEALYIAHPLAIMQKMAMAASQCMILTGRDEPALPSLRLRLFFLGLFAKVSHWRREAVHSYGDALGCYVISLAHSPDEYRRS